MMGGPPGGLGQAGGPQPGGPPAVPPPVPGKEVPAGQGVLWSVGEDKRDDGGRQQAGPGNAPTGVGEDLIFLVPLPPRR
jgi:hypothetical protein